MGGMVSGVAFISAVSGLAPRACIRMKGAGILESDTPVYYGEHPIVDVFYPAAAA